jgi:hypothetical protein
LVTKIRKGGKIQEVKTLKTSNVDEELHLLDIKLRKTPYDLPPLLLD